VLVKNGLAMESFLDKLVDSSRNGELVVIDTSRGLTTIASPQEKADHPHDHGHAHAHGTVNPHIWLDPLRAVQQVETIRDGLVKADPSCAEGYRRNAAAFIGQLRQLNSEIAAQLRPYRGKTFVAFHDVAPYFAQRYGLKAAFLVDVPELNPSPADLLRVAAEVRQSQLQALLSGPQEGNRSFNALAQDLGIRISVFDPIETAAAQAATDPTTYVTVMRRNAAALTQAFGR
jgi:zinc/manganese transport system substrate-binding protein